MAVVGIVRATATSTFRGDSGRFIAGKITPAVRAGVEAFGQLVLDEAKAIVPVDTGELRDSGVLSVEESEKRVVATVAFTAGHAAFVEYGTGRRGSESSGAMAGIQYSLNWPGMAAQPFLRPAIDIARDAGRELFNSQVSSALKI